jgi:Lrp/AsnC family leucine-responsive transcriptional regulator
MNSSETPDWVDVKILNLLAENARRSFGDIGSNIGMSPSAVKRRVDRLERTGVIRRYTTEVDHAKLGQTLEAFTEVRFEGGTRVDDIEGIAADSPEVVAVFTMAGDPDALAWLRVRDVHHLKQVVDKIRSIKAVTGTKTLMVLGSSLRSGQGSSPLSGTITE